MSGLWWSGVDFGGLFVDFGGLIWTLVVFCGIRWSDMDFSGLLWTLVV